MKKPETIQISTEPYCVKALAYDPIWENHQLEYYVRVEFSRKLDVISNRERRKISCWNALRKEKISYID